MMTLEKRMHGVIQDHNGSLANIVKTLQIDAVSSNESKQFLEDMEQFN